MKTSHLGLFFSRGSEGDHLNVNTRKKPHRFALCSRIYYFIYEERCHLVFSNKNKSLLTVTAKGNAAEKSAVERLAVRNLKFPPEGK